MSDVAVAVICTCLMLRWFLPDVAVGCYLHMSDVARRHHMTSMTRDTQSLQQQDGEAGAKDEWHERLQRRREHQLVPELVPVRQRERSETEFKTFRPSVVTPRSHTARKQHVA